MRVDDHPNAMREHLKSQALGKALGDLLVVCLVTLQFNNLSGTW